MWSLMAVNAMSDVAAVGIPDLWEPICLRKAGWGLPHHFLGSEHLQRVHREFQDTRSLQSGQRGVCACVPVMEVGVMVLTAY